MFNVFKHFLNLKLLQGASFNLAPYMVTYFTYMNKIPLIPFMERVLYHSTAANYRKYHRVCPPFISSTVLHKKLAFSLHLIYMD
jgi:hypothetical protein